MAANLSEHRPFQLEVDQPSRSVARAGTDRLPGLDGLRAIAVILVLLLHFCPPFPSGSFLNTIIARGGFGTDIFFVLSGFLITHLLLREEKSHGRITLRLFYFRRALRILPPLLLYLLFLFVVANTGAIYVPNQDFFAGLLFFRNFGGISKETAHLWTLGIEEQFYLAWPFLLVLIPGTRWRFALLAGVILASPFWRQLNYYFAGGAWNVDPWRTDLRIDPIAIGALLALMRFTPTTRKYLVYSSVRGLWLTGAALLFLSFALLTNLLEIRVFRAFLFSFNWMCVAIIINCAIQDGGSPLTSLLELGPLVWIGKLSYSWYLWQQPFASSIGMTPLWFRKFPLGLAFAFILAVCSYYCVERPLLGLRRKLHRDANTKGSLHTLA